MQKKYQLFKPTDKSMFKTMLRTEILQWRLNKTPIWNIPKRNLLFKKIVAEIDGNPYCIISPIHLQQGNNMHIGKNFFCNYDCKFLDHGGIYIGDNVMLAPNVTIVTSTHPLLADQRRIRRFDNSFAPQKRGNYELVSPVTIGNDVWIATGAVICPGVTIGDNSIIGAGSVVTKDIPPNVLAWGVPAKVIREITEEDKLKISELS